MNFPRIIFIPVFLLLFSTQSFAVPPAGFVCDVSTVPAAIPDANGNIREDVLVLVNDNSPDSCAVGKYYAEKRNLGPGSIALIKTRPQHALKFPEFRVMMDQIINYMQNNTLINDAQGVTIPPAAICPSGSISNYYCSEAITHLRDNTKIRYLVTTRGVPYRTRIDGSTLASPDALTSIDNYLAYWLVRYFPDNNADGNPDDVALNFKEREIAFGDGHSMRTVNTKNDGELIVGRIDGVNLDATKALMDRIIDVEDNGIYGKLYGSKFGVKSPTASWFDYSSFVSQYVYGDSATSWRYQLGLFGEAQPECADLALSVAPSNCNVRFDRSGGIFSPGTTNSRTPLVDDALIYLGDLHTQASAGDNFENLKNWVKKEDAEACPDSTAKLCEDFASQADKDACVASSTDVFKEINTECVGVADGFMGYNHVSYPVARMALWPTGYRGTHGDDKLYDSLVPPEVRTDIGHLDYVGDTDSHSLWFRNTDTINPMCYITSDFTVAPTPSCREEIDLFLLPQVTITPQTIESDPSHYQEYHISFWYRADNMTDGATLKVKMGVHETNQPLYWKFVDYVLQEQTIQIGQNIGWTPINVIFKMDPTKHLPTNLAYDGLKFTITTINASDPYIGEIGFDDFSIKELKYNWNTLSTIETELIKNPSFTGGHQQVSDGDHAATYLSRLNGVAYWGSVSHHQSLGHSFSQNPQETLIYFMRGLPLGDAVWWGDKYNSGILYGDPIYSPVAVRLHYINDYDYITGDVALKGDTINGRNLPIDPQDASVAGTSYAVHYCSGADFYECDQAGSWSQAKKVGGGYLEGEGGSMNLALGEWDVTTEGLGGDYVLRLTVSGWNESKGRLQADKFSLYDYYPVHVMDPAEIIDSDDDGLTNYEEIVTHGTDPYNPDTDGDGVPDGWEIDNNFYPNDANDNASSAYAAQLLITISYINRTEAKVGDLIQVTGENFCLQQCDVTTSTETVISIGGQVISPGWVINDRLWFRVPAGAEGTGPVTVTVHIGEASISASYGSLTVIPAPTITSISLTEGKVGDLVFVYGSNLCELQCDTTTSTETVVYVGGVGIPPGWVINDRLWFYVPSGAEGTGPIVVTISGQAAASEQLFTVIPPPTITSISLTEGKEGDLVFVYGDNLCIDQCDTTTTTETFIFVGGVYIPAGWVNNDRLWFRVPAGAEGIGPIVVITTTSGKAATSEQLFTVIPSPTITLISTTSAQVGDLVEVVGTNLCYGTGNCNTTTSTDTFVVAGGQVTTPSWVETDRLQFLVPDGAVGTEPIVVITMASGKAATSSQEFTVIP